METTVLTATTLSDDQVAWLSEFFSSPGPGRKLRHVRKGAVLFQMGAEVTQIFFLITGQIKVNAISPEGTTALHEICGPQSWLEEGAIIVTLRAHSHTAVATMDSEIVAFPLTTFQTMLEDHAPLKALFVFGMAHHIVTMHDVLEDQLFNAADKRAARTFLAMFTGKDVKVLPIEMTPTRLGELVGATRQTAHVIINRFRANGLITKKDRELYHFHKEPLERFLRP